MKKLITIILILEALPLNGQDYLINFSGTGISTILVENLNSGLSVNLSADDVLHLSTVTNIYEEEKLMSPNIKIYPNPTANKSTLVISAPVTGDVIISVYDLTGRVLTRYFGYLDTNIQEFILSDIGKGIHFVNVKGKGFQFSEKLLSIGKSNTMPIIERASNNSQIAVDKQSINYSKGPKATVDMAYTTGERLKYTASSGNNRTIETDIPTTNKTVTFSFVECKDGDNNYYPIVKIGAQTWMAENLKTQRLNDGQIIPLVSDNTLWEWSNSLGCCSYNNYFSNKDIYGYLYNFWAVSTDKLCPTGWHVPTTFEWSTLATYLGGETIAGGKLKETGTSHWNSPNTGATNETGFSALPGGYRNWEGTFDYIRDSGVWWSSTISGTQDACDWDMSNITSILGGYVDNIKSGISVRCLKD